VEQALCTIVRTAQPENRPSPMISRTEEATRILQQWQANSSKLRVVFGNNCTLVACHCRVHSVDDASWIWCTGDEVGDEIRFDLTGAISIELINCDNVADKFEFLAELVDQSVSITWADGTRLNLVKEKRRMEQKHAS
jgi:hypothetical protein